MFVDFGVELPCGRGYHNNLISLETIMQLSYYKQINHVMDSLLPMLIERNREITFLFKSSHAPHHTRELLWKPSRP